ncbi:nuclease A inhibitor family protein [Arcicella sp. LKC2W]|uniref:nuclease A inhibitor family protein n=1 Tax=Arcicella sp. LKC2W TaxID=2984198 RepID=UPI002B1FDA1D|nr:nuclease A inhibitor family protein [Arcicella sp. LKC2W]MEA5458464.1 nuclease A inhibitor family protein [Arcicella sp. LKC2W]
MTENMGLESQETASFFLKEQIQVLTTGLLYPSESDEKIEYFEMELSTEEKINQANFRMFNGIKPEINITEMDFEAFFKPLIKIEDWYGEEEKKWATDGLTLKSLLTEKTKDVQIFKVGEISIDVYLFGKAEECKWVGLKTKVIET